MTSKENIPNPSEANGNEPNPWDSLSEYDAAKRQLEDDLLNIDDMLRSGRITKEKAEQYRKEVTDRADKAMGISTPEAQPESVESGKEFAKFQVASGTSKEAEFKRLTGEDWPGEKYYAVTYGVDEGYDEPIENWTIYERPSTEAQQQPEAITNDEEFAKFQVASGTSKEAEFKRLTGEDWPGEKYYAVSYGIDEGYDEPIENWTIYKRSSNEQAPIDVPEGGENSKDNTPPDDEGGPDNTGTPEGKNNPEGENNPEGKDNPEGEGNPEGNKNKVDLGDPTVKKLEIAIDEDKAERLKEIEEKLNKMLPELAELYARNRRIFVGAKNRADFIRVKGEYAKLLDEALRLKSEASFNTGMGDLSEKLQERADELTQQVQAQLLEFVGGDPENTEKTQEEVDAERKRLIEEAEKTLRAEYSEMTKELETNVNADFLSNYLEEAAKLEDATIDALDNGTACRRFVNKVLNNKVFKGAIIAAAGIGLAATGVGLGMGLAAGTMSVSLGYTAGGVALGAGKGALMGGLMSRQNSKNSAVRGFVSEEEIKSQLESINSEDDNAASLADWLLDQYSGAKDQDLASNRKRTALSAGIGAVIGGLMSGVHINNIERHEVTERVRTGTEPDKTVIDLFDKVNIPEGHGMYDTFTQMGGNPDDLQQALNITHSIDAKYGLVPGSNGVVPGSNGLVGAGPHTEPGFIKDWSSISQSYITEVAEAWAKAGLIPSHTVAGGPIYDTITRVVINQVPNAFMNFLARATATVGAGAIGGVIGGVGRERSRIGVETPAPEPETPEVPETPPEPIPEIPTSPETPNGVEAPAEPDTTPEGETLNGPVEELRSKIGEEGLEIMSSQEPTSPATTERVANWWNTLDDDTKRIVEEYATQKLPAGYGQALKDFLLAQTDNVAIV